MIQTPFIIRNASIDDACLLAELGAETFREAYAQNNEPDTLSKFIESTFDTGKQARELSDNNTLWFIAEAQGKAIGYAMLRKGKWPTSVTGVDAIELGRIYVLASWHGRGVGPALLQACLDEATRQGKDVVWLGVWEHNPRAIAFYEKWGFVQVGAHSFQFGTETQQDLLMQRAVSLPQP